MLLLIKNMFAFDKIASMNVYCSYLKWSYQIFSLNSWFMLKLFQFLQRNSQIETDFSLVFSDCHSSTTLNFSYIGESSVWKWRMSHTLIQRYVLKNLGKINSHQDLSYFSNFILLFIVLLKNIIIQLWYYFSRFSVKMYLPLFCWKW